MEREPLVAAAVARGLPQADAERLAETTLHRFAYRARHSGKRCRGCGRELPLSAFGRYSASADGLRPQCRECRHAAYLVTRGPLSI